MKIQLNLDLGKIDWSAKSPLETAGCCDCRDQGRSQCECGQGKTLYFRVIPVSERGEGERVCCQAEVSCD